MMAPGYNASARYAVRGAWEFYLKGSFIYWQPKEQGLEVGILTSAASDHQDRIKNLNFDYKPGFKVTVGTNFDHDKWSLEAQYTRLHSKEDRHFYAASPEYITPSWHDQITAAVDNAKEQWKLLYDTIDLHLLRADYSGKAITLTPFLEHGQGGSNKNYTLVITPHKTYLQRRVLALGLSDHASALTQDTF